MPMKDGLCVLPPLKQPIGDPAVDAELLALRTLVLYLTRERAVQQPDPQAFVNDMAATCADAILGADVAASPAAADRLRRDAAERVGAILAGVRFPSGERQ